jgi:tetratricopeptide (TPR) repeat protein/tRNA A-37 threonylcarbamoyl transferase component Bud32
VNDPSRLQTLFAAALERPATERDTFLVQVCGDDVELLRDLRALLATDARLDGMTARPVLASLGPALAALSPSAPLGGQRVGPFELREELGHGGMGRVYRAERVDGTVAQVVAIKFVRRELLDPNTLKRFQLERQLMASLDHPHVARLLDAAELADGTPYYVMEYVDGVPIDEYCRRERLDLRARLGLVRKVCSAVAEAHRKLIAHRDLKPANILITADGTPKLLDFGIAKPLSLSAHAILDETGTAQRYFSPNYAAPEQLRGGNVGIACDVYALGLLLYELLAERRPFDFTGLSAGEAERLILEVPAPAPSAARGADADAPIRARQLRGELDDIVLRCLRKAPGERYASVDQLQAELDNHLSGRPVLARGGHRWYRMQKFVRRNRVGVAAVALIALSLLGGLAAFAWQARIAQQRAAELQQVARFQAGMLDQIDPSRGGEFLGRTLRHKLGQALDEAGVDAAERERRLASFDATWEQVNATDATRELIDEILLKPALVAIDRQFAAQPTVDATLSQALSELYSNFGLFEPALPLQQRALEKRRDTLGEEHPDTLSSIDSMGILLAARGDQEEGERWLREALDKRRRVLGENHIDTVNSKNHVGVVMWERGDLAETERYMREVLEQFRLQLGEEDPRTVTSIHNIGALLQTQGKPEEAIPFLTEALEKRRRLLPPDDPYTLGSINQLGTVYRDLGRIDEAEPLFRETLERRRRTLGESHPDTLLSIVNYGGLLRAKGQPFEAEPHLRTAFEGYRAQQGDDSPFTAIARGSLGTVLQDQGKSAEAVELLAPHEAAARRALDGLTLRLSRYLVALGRARTGTGAFADAESSLLEAVQLLDAKPGATPADRRATHEAIVALYRAWNAAVPDPKRDATLREWERRPRRRRVPRPPRLPVDPRPEDMSRGRSRIRSIRRGTGARIAAKSGGRSPCAIRATRRSQVLPCSARVSATLSRR